MSRIPLRQGLALFLFAAAVSVAQTLPATPEVRFLCFAPSPYTNRHDAFRAGMGILLSLRRVIQENHLPLRTSFYDGIPSLEDRAKGKVLLRGARVLVFGGSTWAQGSAYYLRRYFEWNDLVSLEGVSATAWATAGGYHTGGEVVIGDTLRTLMGMGAQVFSLGQKYMVFTTDERLDRRREGQFTLLDCWYMEQFAKSIAVVALAGDDRTKAGVISKEIGYSPFYWDNLPKKESSLAERYGTLRDRINAAADPNSAAYKGLRSLLMPY